MTGSLDWDFWNKPLEPLEGGSRVLIPCQDRRGDITVEPGETLLQAAARSLIKAHERIEKLEASIANGDGQAFLVTNVGYEELASRDPRWAARKIRALERDLQRARLAMESARKALR